MTITDWGYEDRRWFADVNGDGKTDFCRAVGTGSGEGSFLACSLSITGSGGNDIMTPIADWGYGDRRWFVDVNGDGKADFCRAVGNGWGEGSFLGCSLSITSSGALDAMVPVPDWGYGDRRWFGDVNGDKKVDFCRAVGQAGGSDSYLACSTSILSSSANDTLVTIADWGYPGGRWLADVNGDGKADYCRAVGNWGGEQSWLGCSLSATTSGNLDEMIPISDWGHEGRRWLIDVSGDGKADVVRAVGNSLGDCSYVRHTLGIDGNGGEQGPHCIQNNLLASNGGASFLSDNGTFWQECLQGEKWTLLGQDDGSYCIQNDLLASNGGASFLSDNGTFWQECLQGEKWTLLEQDDGSYCIQNNLLASNGGASFLSDNGTFWKDCLQGEKWSIMPGL